MIKLCHNVKKDKLSIVRFILLMRQNVSNVIKVFTQLIIYLVRCTSKLISAYFMTIIETHFALNAKKKVFFTLIMIFAY